MRISSLRRKQFGLITFALLAAGFGGCLSPGVDGKDPQDSPGSTCAAVDHSGGTPLWSRSFGTGVGDDRVWAVATDSADNIYITGWHTGSIDFGGGPFGLKGNAHFFIAKFDGNANHVRSVAYGIAGAIVGHDLVADAQGNLIITGELAGTVDFGGGALESDPNYRDAFVVKFDAGGNHLWSKLLNGPNEDYATSATVDAENKITITGTGVGIKQFDAGGTLLWERPWDESRRERGHSVAADSAGNLVIVGCTNGSDFGDGQIKAGLFVLKLDGTGKHVFSEILDRWTCPDGALGPEVAIDTTDDIVIAGVRDDVDYQDYPVTTAAVAKLDTNGNLLFSKSFGEAFGIQWSQMLVDAKTDPANNIVIAGFYKGEGGVNFGCGPHPSVAWRYTFLAKLDSTGSEVFSKHFGTLYYDTEARGVAVDSQANIVLAGWFANTVDFGTGPLTSVPHMNGNPGFADLFIAKYGP